ncbi:MAG: hypothetical protein U1F43_25040 [Myxococcota bacterium]
MAGPLIDIWAVGPGASGALTTLSGHTDEGEGVAFPALRDTLISAGRDGRVRRWVLTPGGTELGSGDIAALGGPAIALELSPDGAWIGVTAKNGAVRRWHVQGGDLAVAGEQSHDGPALCLSLTDAGLLASGGHDGLVKLLPAEPGVAPRVLAGHQGAVTALAFARDGRRLVSGSDDRTVRVWDVASGEAHIIDLFDGPVVALTMLGDSFVALADEPVLRLWPLAIPAERAAVMTWLPRVARP